MAGNACEAPATLFHNINLIRDIGFRLTIQGKRKYCRIRKHSTPSLMVQEFVVGARKISPYRVLRHGRSEQLLAEILNEISFDLSVTELTYDGNSKGQPIQRVWALELRGICSVKDGRVIGVIGAGISVGRFDASVDRTRTTASIIRFETGTSLQTLEE